MPELPEVETMCRGILGSLGGRITAVRRPKSHLQPIAMAPPLGRFRRQVLGRTIEAVGRIGKRVVLHLDSDDRIVFEPRMTGRILVGQPPNTAHLRLVLELQGSAIPRVMFWDVRGLGLVHLFSAERFLQELGPERIGPDALQITNRELRRRLGASRRAIKVALLDQRAVSGIGNLYASEILYDAAIHPALPCRQLRPKQWQRLKTSVRRILEEAIRCQGSTLGDGTYRTALDEAGGYQEHHRVYQRAGQPCVRCGSQAIVRLVQAQRSTFFCPGCQLQ
jgi:formamidopyrimidine-DNA glycosylase